MQLHSLPFSKHHRNKYASPNLLSTNDFAFVMYKQSLKEPEAGNKKQFVGNKPYTYACRYTVLVLKKQCISASKFVKLFLI